MKYKPTVEEKNDGIWYDLGDGKERYEQHYCSHLMIKRSYKNNKKHGAHILYNTRGKMLKYEEYENGIYNGRVEIFFNGHGIESSCLYVNGKKHGIYKLWYKDDKINGKVLARSIQYRFGIKHGKYLAWDAMGKLIINDIYKNGKLMVGMNSIEDDQVIGND